MTTTPLALAASYLARGWAVVPIPYRTKRPVLDGWQKLRFTPETLPQHFNGRAQNVGVILGEASGGLADVDLDCLEAIELAPQFLPPTATFGRASKPASHWLYAAPGAQTRQFKASPSETLVELRAGGSGHQTVFPGSVHECGEPIEWTAPDATPAALPATDLAQRVAQLAVACLILRRSPGHLEVFREVPDALPSGLPPDVAALASEWLGLSRPASAKPAPRVRSASALSSFEEARRAFNQDHPLDATKRGRACPACEGKNSFKGDATRATCFHSSHPDTCGTRCEGTGAPLFVFDGLDLCAHLAGRTPREHLTTEGYWARAPQPAPQPASPPPRDVLRDAPASQQAPVVHIGDSLDEAKALFRRRHDGTEKPMPLPWPGVAKALGGGLWPGAHVLTGTTAAGKTAYAIQVAVQSALSAHPVLYIGLELDTAQIVARLASMVLGEEQGRVVAHWSDIYLGKISPSRTEEAIESLRRLPIYVEEAPPGGWSARSMRARVEDLRLKHPGVAPLVVLDFLQLVGPSDPGGRREELRERIGAAAYAGREVARKCGAVVLMISSISRGGASELLRMGNDDELGVADPADLVGLGKESGDIEFSADSVMVLAREPRDESAPKDAPANIWLALAKQRAGRPCWVPLTFNGSWLEESGSRAPGARQDERREAKAKADAERRTREYEWKLSKVLKALEQASPETMSVHALCAKLGARPSGFKDYLVDLENRGLVHQTMFGRKSLGWAFGPSQTASEDPKNDAFPCVPMRSGNEQERVGTVCVPVPYVVGTGNSSRRPEASVEKTTRPAPPADPQPAPRPSRLSDAERQRLLTLPDTDDYLEAMAARPPEPDPAAEAIRQQVLRESGQADEECEP
jgi:replicative DNA helicase